jgi:hypothetical protein
MYLIFFCSNDLINIFWNRSTGERLAEPMDSLLSDLLQSEKLFNGESIRLDYADE